MADTFSILGKQFESNRGVPGDWRFTRPTQKESYRQALEKLALNKRTAGMEGVSEDAMYAEGLQETNSADDAQLATGAMKFIAAADFMLEPYKAGNVTSLDAPVLLKLDAPVLLKATRAYHFAANTLRQQQQFELSADFYLMAAGSARSYWIRIQDVSSESLRKRMRQLGSLIWPTVPCFDRGRLIWNKDRRAKPRKSSS